MLGVKTIEYENSIKKIIITTNPEFTITFNGETRKLSQKLAFEYIYKLTNLLEEWDKEYYDSSIIDGDNWQIIITNSDGTKETYQGHGSYPYNFEIFERLNDNLLEVIYHEY